MKSHRSAGRRTLRTEPLEKRELLAADMGGWGAAASMPVMECLDGVCEERVQQREQAEDCDSMPVMECSDGVREPWQRQRDRSQEDCETGEGAQQRPRDRDSQTNEDQSDADAATLAGAVDAVLEATAARGDGSGGGGSGGQEDPTVSPLNEAEVEDILFIREEEKLARDVYITLGEQWGTAIFENIAQSEQNHMDAMKSLIDTYGLTDPIVDDTVGVFENAVLQQLYDDLVSDQTAIDLSYAAPGLTIDGGGSSLVAALEVGAFIEEYDIIDIQHAQEDATQADVQAVYDNLLRGSRNHLRSFVGQLDARGEDYEPVLMTGVDPVTGIDLDALYLEIIGGTTETGGGGNGGGGGGGGGGRGGRGGRR